MNTKASTLGFSSPPCSEIVRQQPAKEKYFSYLTFLTTLEQVFVTWFFPQSRFFLLFHLCCTSGLSHSLSFHGFSHQRNSLAFFFFFKHSRQGTYSWCRWVFSLERVVVVVVTTAGRLWGRGLNSFSFHGFDHFCLSIGHPSSPTFKSGVCSWVCNCCRQIFEERKKVRACNLFWKECPFLSRCCICTPLKCKGGVWMLDQGCPYPHFWVILGLVSIPILP